MNNYQKLGLLLTGTSFVMMTNSVQAAMLTQSFSIDLNNQPLNSNTKLLLPKFDSLLGKLVSVYMRVDSTVNTNLNVTASETSNFMGNVSTNANLAVNLPTLKADPTLLLRLAAESVNTSITGGNTGNLNSSKSGSTSTTITDSSSLSALSGCSGDTIALIMALQGGVNLNGSSGPGAYDGDISNNSKLTVDFNYEGKDSESVPEPMTITGLGLAVAVGGWWRRKLLTKN